MPERERRTLVALVALAFALRSLSLFWGLPVPPFHRYHPDEYTVLYSVLNFPRAYLRNQLYLYGTAFQYAVAVATWPLRPMSEAEALIACRLAVAASGAAAVLLVHRLGRRLFDGATGLAAAALLAASAYHCACGGFATLDEPMSALLLLDALLCLRAVESGRAADWALLGAGAGLLAATKIVGALFFIVPLMLAGRRAAGGVALAAGVAAAVFCATTPHVPLHPREYWAFMMGQKAAYVDPQRAGAWRIAGVWGSQTVLAIGWPAALLALAGAPLAGRRLGRVALALGALLAAYHLFWRGYLLARFVVFLAPLYCLLAACACRALPRWAGAAALALALGASLRQTALAALSRRDDPRDRAASYLSAAVGRGETLAFGPWPRAQSWIGRDWRYPYADWRRCVITEAAARPNWIVASSYDPELPEELARDYAVARRFEPRPRVESEFAPPEIVVYRKLRPDPPAKPRPPRAAARRPAAARARVRATPAKEP